VGAKDGDQQGAVAAAHVDDVTECAPGVGSGDSGRVRHQPGSHQAVKRRRTQGPSGSTAGIAGPGLGGAVGGLGVEEEQDAGDWQGSDSLDPVSSWQWSRAASMIHLEIRRPRLDIMLLIGILRYG